ncbi:UNVERIFIED_CONTAM: hypothetical protein Slati_0512200 [Sesamum latifolium]|uniref:Reverse transcriptase domain-containing protein n=1 Tax=Sesamum latifolium TaxID=2727402 RepID=A0AAW2Y0R6_9LAMI
MCVFNVIFIYPIWFSIRLCDAPKGTPSMRSPIPYLFLLCTEAFSSLLQREEQSGQLQGVAVCRQAPRVSHLLFADDTLIFCQASVEAATCILEVLETFGPAAGQEINFAKSSVTFSKNTTDSIKAAVQDTLQIRMEGRHDLYLGLHRLLENLADQSSNPSETEYGIAFVDGTSALFPKQAEKFSSKR